MTPIIHARSASLEDRVGQLEEALMFTIDALQSVVKRLECKLGPEFLGADLKYLAAADSDADLLAIIDSIEDSLKAGEKSAATQQIRSAFGCTWDEAYRIIGKWHISSRKQKLRSLRLARYIKSIETAEPDSR